MKKVLLAIAAIATITSCTQNEEFENPAQKAEISFNTAAVTRATAMVTDNFKEFQVYGYAHTGDFTEATEGTYLVNGYFKKNESGEWIENTALKFYWPSSDNVTFFAYSPVPGEGDTSTTYNAPTGGKGSPTINYTVADDIASQADFLVAKLTGNGADNKDGVSLGFKHALTQIAFKLKGSDSKVNYSVTKLVLKGIKNSGKYKWADSSWEATATPLKNYTIDMAEAAIEFVGDADATDLTGSDKVLMLIPQSPTDATIDITYTATGKALDGVTDVTYFQNETKSVEVPVTAWEAGKRIIFTIVLSPNIINISGNVDENNWTNQADQPSDLQ